MLASPCNFGQYFPFQPAKSRRKQKTFSSRRFRPRLELLEDRAVPAIEWVAPGGGEWSDANNWRDPVSMLPRTPAGTDDVALPGGNAYTVATGACHSVSVGDGAMFTISGSMNVVTSASFGGFGGMLTLTGTSATLNVDGDFSTGGTLRVDGGSLLLSATGANAIGGDFFWSGGIFLGGSVAAPIELTHPAHISGSSTKEFDAVVDNHSTISHEGSGTLLGSNGSKLTNAGMYDLASDATLDFHSAAGFVNEGTLHKSAGTGIAHVNGFISDHGTVDVDSGHIDLLLQVGMGTDMSIDVAMGTTASFHSDGLGGLQGSFTPTGAGHVLLNGSLTIGPSGATFDAPEGLLEWTSGTITTGAAPLTNGHYITLSGTSQKTIAGTLVNHGTMLHGGTGTLIVNGTLENDETYTFTSDAWISATSGFFINNGLLAKTSGTGSSQILGRFRNPGGTFELSSGNVTLPPNTIMEGADFFVLAPATLDLQGGTYTGIFTGAGDGHVELVTGVMTAGAGGAVLDMPLSIFQLRAGNFDGGADGFTVAAGSNPVLPPSGMTLAPTGTLNLQGLITNDGIVDHQASSAVPQLSGTFQNRNSYVFNPGANLGITGFGTFINQSEFRKPAGAANATQSGGGHFTNEGIVTVETGRLNGNAWTNSGTIDVEAGATLGMTGTYAQSAGSTIMDGTFAGSNVTISGGILRGIGTLTASSVLVNGGTTTPGDSPGRLTINGPYQQTAAGALAVELNGTTPGTFDQLGVNGTVRLDGLLTGSCGFVPALGDVLTIIDNDGTDAVIGTFLTQPEGSELTFNSSRFRISYVGGTGNDVTLTTISSANHARLEPDPLQPDKLMLVVDGTASDDRITLVAGPRRGDVRVRFGRTVEGPFRPTSRMVVYGYEGADVIRVSSGLSFPAWLYGGVGNDNLTGGSGANVLLGGENDDTLVGRNARDLMIGGTGKDRLRGNGGEDLLIAGGTVFDGEAASLFAIQAEWLGPRRYASRLANVTGDDSNPEFASRLNQSNYLVASGANATLFDDGVKDELFGGSGIDAFFASSLDTVFRPSRPETIIVVT